MIPVSPHQFSFFRIIMGTYLLIHFANLIPYAPEMFSNQGLIPQRALESHQYNISKYFKLI